MFSVNLDELFAMSRNLQQQNGNLGPGEVERPPSPVVEDDDGQDPAWAKKKRRIVRKLLKEFDLDKVREKYRCTNPIEFRVHPSEYSVDW